MSKSRRVLFAAALCVTPIMALTTANSAFAVPASSSSLGTLASGSNWSITAAAGGYSVTLKLADKLPVVNDAPTLVVDGELLGLATESTDGLSLSAFTTDPSVLSAKSVTKGWSSGDADKAEEDSAVAQTPASSTDVKLQKRMAAAAKAETLDAEAVVEPSELGSYSVTEAEYDFGNQAIALAGISGIRGEMTGKMYLTDATGARPTVILLHGRHTSCSTGTANPLRWPCGDNQVNVRSYLGYEGTARALASNGYNVLSIAANAINSNDNQLALDYGAQARGQLILDTLTMLKKASAGESVSYDDAQTAKTVTLDEAFVNATTRKDQPAAISTVTAASLVGKFDLTQVGIMGHSRGGEGVTSAATLNQALANPFGIEAVLPLAPVDFGRMTVSDVPMAVFLPYCDGDVSNQQGQHMVDDSRSAFDDNVLRSAVWVMGADHNFFNSVWTPGQYTWATGDDWSTGDKTSTCSTTSATRLTSAQQYQVGVSYMTGFFRYTMGHENQFAYLFDGSVKPSTTATAGFADVRVMASQPHDKTAMLTDFTTQSSLTRTYGTSTAAVCTNLTGRTLPQSLAYCATTKASSQVPHWTPASFAPNVPATPVTKFMWTSATGELRVTVPAAKRDVSAYSQLTLKTAPEETVPTGTDFSITVVDGKNQSYSVLASAINPLAVNRMPGGTNATLNKIVLQQLTIPTSTITGVDLTDVREVRIKAAVGADTTTTGGVYLSDLAFDTPSLGTPSLATRTAVNVESTSAEEGNGPGTVDIPVSLNRADKNTVVAYVSVVGTATGKVGLGMEKVSFSPGETCKVVTVSTLGDSTASATPTSLFKVSATNTQNAVMGKSAFNNVTVREDDGVTGTGIVAAPAVGVQGDVCAEAAAAKITGTLTLSASTVAPGDTLTTTAGGYRSGESVSFTLTDGTVLDSVIADSTGTAVSTVTVPNTIALGTTTITALGAGSKYATAAELKVLAPTTTTLSLDPEVPSIAEAVTLTATVAGADTTGDVTFLDGTTTLGTAAVTDGTAALTLDDGFPAGDHSITASFAATSTANASTSEAIAFTLKKGVPTLSMTVSAPTQTFGTPATVTATVEGSTTGTVHFTYGTDSSDVEISDGTAQLVLPAAFSVGNHTITATLLETATTEASTTATTQFSVTKAATKTVATYNTKTVTKGKSVTATATIRGTKAETYPTGYVRVYIGTTRVKTVTLTAADKGIIKATFATPTKKGSSVSVIVRYAGDSTYVGSTSEKATLKLK